MKIYNLYPSKLEGTSAIFMSVVALISLVVTILWALKIYITYKKILNCNKKKLLEKLNCSAEEELTRWLASVGHKVYKVKETHTYSYNYHENVCIMVKYKLTNSGDWLAGIVSDDGTYSDFKKWKKENEILIGECLLADMTQIRSQFDSYIIVKNVNLHSNRNFIKKYKKSIEKGVLVPISLEHFGPRNNSKIVYVYPKMAKRIDEIANELKGKEVKNRIDNVKFKEDSMLISEIEVTAQVDGNNYTKVIKGE